MFLKNSLEDIKIINLPKIDDHRGNLSFFESNIQIPFKINRVYWIYDVPGGKDRGGHAFKMQNELIIALSGTFDIEVKDENKTKLFSLNRSYTAIYIPSGIWRKMINFSTNSLALVASSSFFSEEDYIRDFDNFLKLRKNEKN